MTTKRKKPARPRARRRHVVPAKAVINRKELEARGIRPRAGQLGTDTQVGKLGLVLLKLSRVEEKILSAPVDVKDVEVRGDGALYLPHTVYTYWFNRAFGRIGWTVVPASKPRRERGDVLCDYLLYVHGKPVAFATGRQEHPQAVTTGGSVATYGDALEATIASALRRFAKRLGVGLELWDRKFIEAFLTQRCIRVWRRSEKRPQYRLLASAAFHDEEGIATEGGSMNDRRDPAAGEDGQGNERISRKQLGRMFGIIKRVGRREGDVRAWLNKAYGLASTKDIRRRDYDRICSAIEANRPLTE